MPEQEKIIISIQVQIDRPVATAWQVWTTPEHITQWNFASDEWQCPSAQNDLKVGGQFNYRMEAKDGSMGFDFKGVYDDVIPGKNINYHLLDGRKVWVSFEEKDGGTLLKETFEAEDQNSAEMQRQGWQAILNNFKDHAESKAV